MRYRLAGCFLVCLALASCDGLSAGSSVSCTTLVVQPGGEAAWPMAVIDGVVCWASGENGEVRITCLDEFGIKTDKVFISSALEPSGSFVEYIWPIESNVLGLLIREPGSHVEILTVALTSVVGSAGGRLSLKWSGDLGVVVSLQSTASGDILLHAEDSLMLVGEAGESRRISLGKDLDEPVTFLSVAPIRESIVVNWNYGVVAFPLNGGSSREDFSANFNHEFTGRVSQVAAYDDVVVAVETAGYPRPDTLTIFDVGTRTSSSRVMIPGSSWRLYSRIDHVLAFSGGANAAYLIRGDTVELVDLKCLPRGSKPVPGLLEMKVVFLAEDNAIWVVGK